MPAGGSTLAAGRPGLVLVVEDFDDCRELYADALSVAGYSVIEAGDGIRGLAKAVIYLPDVVVLDLGLPGLDGCEVIRRLRRNPRTQHVRILVLTGDSNRLHAAIGAGCDAVLAKPCLPATLIARVRRFLRTGPAPS